MNVNAIPLIPIPTTSLLVKKLPADQSWPAAPEPPSVGQVNADNDPSKLYATIQKGGKTIATLYTSGLMVTPNGVALPPDLAMDGHGVSLADKRLQQMLKMYGGTAQYMQSTAGQNTSVNASTLLAAQIAGQSPSTDHTY